MTNTEKIKKMFDECNAKELETVKNALELMKGEADTYRELYEKMQNERRQLTFDYEGRLLYGKYFEGMVRLIENEKSDLPISAREVKKMKEITLKIGADTTELDVAIEKANQLKALLAEVRDLTNSLDVKITFEKTT